MIVESGFRLSTNDMLVLGSIGLICIAIAVWRIFYVDRKPGDDHLLTDGAVFLLSNGMVNQLSSEARALLGDCLDQPVVRALESFLGPNATDVQSAVNRLEMTGDPVDMLVHTPDGRAFELIGRPFGAMIRMVLRDAYFLDSKLRDAEQRVTEADTVLQAHNWEKETMKGLIADAPIIAWNRTEEGQINWSSGSIRTRSSVVSSEQTVDLIVARTKLNNQPMLAGQPQRSRIEIVVNDNSETISLHVNEIIRPDGSRLGFATDAGTAASAERTLTRFVQTMTETFAHLTVGLAIFDRNQTLALFNPALVQMWQVEPAWLARRPSLRDIIDELRATRRLPELQDFHKWRSRLLTLFENTEAADYEELWHLADGSNIRVLARPHPHGSLAFIFDDVTERMRLEQRYRHSIDLRRATLDRLTEGIAVFGANGLLQFVNQSFHEIWDTDSELIYAAMHARQLISLCEELTVESEIWRKLHIFITGEESRRAWTTRLTMGSGRILTARFAPLPDGSTMAVFADITDSERIALALHERNDALEVAEEMRATVLGEVSEQLHAPVSAVIESTDQMIASGALPEAQLEQANGIMTAARSLLETVSDVTTLMSLQIDPLQASTESFSLEETLYIAQRILRYRAEDANVTLTVSCDGDDAMTSRDHTRLRQIVFNLASEAIQSAPSGTTVTIGIENTQTDVRIFSYALLADTSEPIDLEQRSLPLVRRLVERVGGRLEITRDDRANAVRVCCIFDNTPPEGSGASNRLDRPAGTTSTFSDNVHTLNSKASG